MAAVLLNTLRGYRASVAFVSAGLLVFSLLITYVFDAFGGLESFQQMEAFLPESVRALIKAQGGLATTLMAFLAATYRHPFYLIAIAGFVIALSSGAVAREVERGGILMVLAAPIPRWRYLLGRIGAMAAGLLALLAAALAGTLMAAQLTGILPDVDLTVLVRIQANAFALGLALGGLAMLLSSVSSDGGRTTGIATAVAAVMFFADYLAVLWAPARPFGPFSFFHYFDPQAVAESGVTPWRDLGVLFGSAAVTFGAALVAFQRRDIAR